MVIDEGPYNHTKKEYTYRYDREGRLSMEQIRDGEKNSVIIYTYDFAGNIIEKNMGKDGIVKYEYEYWK